MQSTLKTSARWVALAALFLIPLTPLLVTNSLFFPFITGKAFYFRALVEIAVAAWAILALIDKAYRPRFSWIGAVVFGFVAWMFVADLFAVNVAKAFWSNFERMEGWVLLIHLLGFFVAAGAVLRVEEKWRAWFLTSLGVSIVAVLYAFFQLGGAAAIHQGSTRVDASLGNSAYFAIYLLFNTFIAGWLALTEERAWLKYSLGALAIIEGILIFLTETRGTVLGLVGALSLAALLAAFTSGARARRYAVGALAVILVLVGAFFALRSTPLVQNNHVLQRVASISLKDGATRFTIWHMAFEGFLERPIVGWGQEGFNYVFNKYYEPSLYAQEPWFDRAHNAFIDWLLAGGLPAFLLYVSLFVIGVVSLWRNTTLSRAERIALTAALTGYAFHNLFVFDNLYSYVYFFAILALIDSQISRPIAWFDRQPEVPLADANTIGVPVVGVLLLASLYFVNWTGVHAAGALIDALSVRTGNPNDNIALFKDVLAHPAFGAQEVREQLVSFAGVVVGSEGVPADVKSAVTTLAVSEMQKQNTEHPGDARTLLQLSMAYRSAGSLQNALKALQDAAALSPHKEQIYIQAGATEWDLGDLAGVERDFNKAYELAPNMPDLANYAATGDIVNGNVKAANALLLATYGTTTVDSDILAIAYYRTKDYQSLIRLWQLRAANPSGGAQAYFGLAAAYYVAGNSVKAADIVREAIQKFPEAAAQGQQFLSQLSKEAK